MCSKNRINHHTKHHTWTPGFLGGNPSREKTTTAVAQPSIFYYRENILQHMCWCRLLPARRHPPALVYQPLLEGSYDPLTRLPASPGRELRPPALVYQPHLERSYDPLISFTSLTWKGATTPWLKTTTLSTSMDHVSSIFTLDPKLPLEHNLQATFHHIFRLDPLHTFKHSQPWNRYI